ncbi:3'(2'),5'-bisphosphate nucleotidase CysQ [candidate division KSB1 bacterium]|nr:3'(2'),5'-bisphosphate nucleotidase CysQ [candidate division KSB1 bacterium]
MLEKELNLAQELSLEAGRIVMSFYDTDVSVSWKNETDPVTQADKDSNEFITAELSKLFSDDGILAEESKEDLNRLSKSRVWLVDPMDGTKEFIEKVGQFSVMIGLVENGRPVLGVVYQPTTDMMLFAVKGDGAFVVRAGEKISVRVSDVAAVDQMRMVVSRSHRAPLVDTIKDTLGIEKEVASGSVGLKVGLLVEQKSDLYIHPNSKTKEGDTCAPQIILEEAGGQMTDCWGNPLTYNKEDVFNAKGFIASNGKAHAGILNKISPFLDQMD